MDNSNCVQAAIPPAISARPPPTTEWEKWFFVPQSRPDSRLRLFCFPYAGGSPWMYRSWQSAVPSDIEICVAHLPGRGKRIDETVPERMEMLVPAIVQAMSSHLDKPYAIFGHSFGGLLSFSLAGLLEKSGLPLPRHLFVSGCPAPIYNAERPLLHTFSEEMLIAEVEKRYGIPDHVRENPAMLALSIALLRADFTLAANYVEYMATIAPPITALYGDADPETSPLTIGHWRSHTCGSFTSHCFSGGHYFLNEQYQQLLTVIEKNLR
jgi:medium-chain acyl-[acyl-carrier-protein] hydrolase